MRIARGKPMMGITSEAYLKYALGLEFLRQRCIWHKLRKAIYQGVIMPLWAPETMKIRTLRRTLITHRPLRGQWKYFLSDYASI